MGNHIKRREFITLLGGVAAATGAPAARAQGDRVRRVAVLVLAAPTETVRVVVLLREELQKRGWREGRNLRLDVRIVDDAASLRVYAEEVVKAAPEVIFALAGPATQVLQARTRTIPIVFVGGVDPVETGLVSNISRGRINVHSRERQPRTGSARLFITD